MRVMLFGATGLVGHAVVDAVIGEPRIRQLVCPVRQVWPNEVSNRIRFPLVDFSDLDHAALDWQADAILIALGTTQAKAGSHAAFEAIDLDLVLEVASRARAAGTPSAGVVSSLGADPEARNFYLSVKGRMEFALRALAFPSLLVLRPSLLAGARSEFRLGERVGLAAANLLRPIVPARYRPVAAKEVGRALLTAALDPPAGEQIVESDEITRRRK